MKENSDFRYDLEVGRVAEIKLQKLISGSKVEVKRDSWTAKTGNLAIEYECRGFPSGIAKTEANWWCFVISGRCQDEVMIMIKTERLKALCREELRLGNIKKMGDSNFSTAVLLPLQKILNEI